MPEDLDHRSRSSRRFAIAAVVVLVVVVIAVIALIAGGGSSRSTATGPAPAAAVPASTPLFAEAVVRPEGSLKSAAQAAGQTLAHQPDPYLRLLTALQTPGSGRLDFGSDLASWLGPRAGIFVSAAGGASGQPDISQLLSLITKGLLGGSATASAFPFGAHGAQGAIVLDATNTSKAGSFLDSQAKLAGAHATSYRGIALQSTAGGVAFALVGHYAVIGSEAGVHDVIDTTLGGPALAHAAGYTKLLAHSPSGTLAHVYVAPATPASTTTSASGGESQGLSGLLGLLAGTRESNISVVPSAASITFDADALNSGAAAASGGLIASGAEGARAAGELPGEAWLAVGLGDAGATLGADVQGLRALLSLVTSFGGSGAVEGAATLSLNGLLKGIFTPLSVLGADSAEAKRDYQSWIGSAGVFGSGSGLLTLKAGVSIDSTNPALSRAAVPELAAALAKSGASVQHVSIPGAEASAAVALPGFPVNLTIADGKAANGQTKFVIGLSEPSVESVLKPTSTLAQSAPYTTASAALGEGVKPSIVVDFPTLLGLLEGVGLTEEPAISKFIPYLRSLTTLAGGGKSLGEGIDRFGLVLGLQHAE
jgi:hypothetical protein